MKQKYIIDYSIIDTSDEISDLILTIMAADAVEAGSAAMTALRNKYRRDRSVKKWKVFGIKLAGGEQPWL